MRITKSKTSSQDFDQRLENIGSDKHDIVGHSQNVTAILGPTNTGKTHLAISRMLEHTTGMIGLPLRLLAREVYDRVVKLKGPEQIALITGEEKIIPKNPNYFICTVEAMPRDLRVDFMAIDEIQLSADPHRGYIFTNRLLNYRGNKQTMFLGAETMRDIIGRLLPDVTFETRPRLSSLSYAGQKKLSRLPRKTAIVAFSADRVYEIAELIRRQKGGAAVVLGALSPRTRNAQIALYQNGEVDYIVATDAIGMGLNLDIDHVAFAATRKFDGKRTRHLNNSELAQVAGRAGRFKNDGTFGITSLVKYLDEDSVHAIEKHEFEPITHLHWRSNQLDFSTIHNLIISLNRPSETQGLVRTDTAIDQATLEYLTKDEDVMQYARGGAANKILWEVASIPDFRKLILAEHATLVSHIYRNLMENGYIDTDWFAKQVSYSDNVDGDIDALSNRIAHIRTWTFIANRPNWVLDVGHWRHVTREIENRLSDALHERLTQRFVDKRTSLLMSRLREKEDIMADVSTAGEVKVEDEFVGHVVGLGFEIGETEDQAQEKALRAASQKQVAAEVSRRVDQIITEQPSCLNLDDHGKICWNEHAIARVEAGDTILSPYTSIISNEYIVSADEKRLGDHVKAWLKAEIDKQLSSLIKLNNPENVTGIARGVAFQLVENYGILVRDEVTEEIKALDQDARKQLRRFGVRFGAYHIFIPQLLKPAPTKLLMLLAALQTAKANNSPLDIPPHPGQGLTSVALDAKMPNNYYQTAGFRKCVTRAVRIDMLERLADLIREVLYWKPKAAVKPAAEPTSLDAAAQEAETPSVLEPVGEARPLGTHTTGGFTVTPNMMSLVGCSGDEFSNILSTIGYQMSKIEIEKSDLDEAAVAVEPAKADETDAITENAVTHVEVWFPARKRANAPTRNNRQKRGENKRSDSKRHDNKRKFDKKQNNKKPNVAAKKPKPTIAPENSPFAALLALKDNA
ncbi:MAG: helicase-related protein [Hyphomicrobiales bacterium]